MRSDFKHVLRLFAKLSDGNPIYTEIPEDYLYEYCANTIVKDYEETIEALKTEGFIYRDDNITEEGRFELVYKLTDEGLNALRIGYNLNKPIIDEKGINLSTTIESAINHLTSSKLNEIRKAEFISTLQEIEICSKYSCLNSTICLSGKLIEIYFTDLLLKNNIKLEITEHNKNGRPTRTRTDLGLSDLIFLSANLPLDIRQIEINNDLINVIRKYRNSAAHYSEKEIKPTIEKVSAVTLFAISIVKEWALMN